MATPLRLFERASIRLGADGLPEIAGSGTDFDACADISVVLRDRMFGHYFHTIEACLAVFATVMEQYPAARVRTLIVGGMAWDNPKQDRMQSQLLAILFPEARVMELAPDAAVELRHVVVLDRALGRNFYGKLLHPLHRLCCRWAPAFRAAVTTALVDHIGTPSPRARPRAIYVPRGLPRCLAPDVQTRLLARLRDEFDVDIVDFAGMAWRDQVAGCGGYDLMCGVHGNGLTNLLWLPGHAGVIEIFPPGVHHYDYQMLCEIMGLQYWGLEGSNLFRDFSRTGAPYGQNKAADRIVAALDWDMVDLAISRAAARHPADPVSAPSRPCAVPPEAR